MVIAIKNRFYGLEHIMCFLNEREPGYLRTFPRHDLAAAHELVLRTIVLSSLRDFCSFDDLRPTVENSGLFSVVPCGTF